MGLTITVLLVLLNAIIVGTGIYLRAYLDKKAENLATKEDFRDLKIQTAELRQTTKEIEAKIDDQLWNRQRQWELKRDIVLELVKVMKEFEQATLALGIAIKSRIAGAEKHKPVLQGMVSK